MQERVLVGRRLNKYYRSIQSLLVYTTNTLLNTSTLTTTRYRGGVGGSDCPSFFGKYGRSGGACRLACPTAIFSPTGSNT